MPAELLVQRWYNSSPKRAHYSQIKPLRWGSESSPATGSGRPRFCFAQTAAYLMKAER